MKVRALPTCRKPVGDGANRTRSMTFEYSGLGFSLRPEPVTNFGPTWSSILSIAVQREGQREGQREVQPEADMGSKPKRNLGKSGRPGANRTPAGANDRALPLDHRARGNPAATRDRAKRKPFRQLSLATEL